jgi:hypothetical protein
MLRLVQIGNALPLSYPADSTSVFEPGNIAQLKLAGQDIVAGLSDGTAPLGIIDDVRSTAFTRPSIDEIVVIKATGILDAYGRYISTTDAKQELLNSNVVPSSFVADYEDLVLNPINGILMAPAGSVLNFDLDGDGKPDSIRTVVDYVYMIPDLPGEDTTVGSNRITIWFTRGVYITDKFDTTQKYPLNAALFVNEDGFLTTRQATPNHPAVAMVTGPPSAMLNNLEFLWL